MCDAESKLFKRFYGNVLTTGCNSIWASMHINLE
jgi:hypothetical protein